MRDLRVLLKLPDGPAEQEKKDMIVARVPGGRRRNMRQSASRAAREGPKNTRRSPFAEMQARIEHLEAELAAAGEGEAATAEVLQVINRSPGDLAPVFDAMLDKAMRLCDAAFGHMTIYDGTRFLTAAHRGLPPRFAEYAVTVEDWPGAHRRLAAGENVVQLLDAKDDEAYQTLPSRKALVDLGGARTVLLVALRKEAALLGGFAIYRQEVRPLTTSRSHCCRTSPRKQ